MRSNLVLRCTVLAISIACAACGTDYQDPFAGGGSGGGGGGGGSGSGGDLPCDVQAVLSNHCTSCHANPPTNGAPMSLLTYADLTAPGAGGVTIAERALIRMQDTAMPMPPAPAPAVSSAEIATFQAWVNGGMPPGSCSTSDPFGAAPTCTSGTYWGGGGDGSSRMRPGEACIACHLQSGGEAPWFSAAGTVYMTGHEPNDCNGSGGATVVITDANGATYNLPVNSAGNFSSGAGMAFPIHAKVVYNGAERAMVAAQTSGDCNTCHTQSGANGAPGRIALP